VFRRPILLSQPWPKSQVVSLKDPHGEAVVSPRYKMPRGRRDSFDLPLSYNAQVDSFHIHMNVLLRADGLSHFIFTNALIIYNAWSLRTHWDQALINKSCVKSHVQLNKKKKINCNILRWQLRIPSQSQTHEPLEIRENFSLWSRALSSLLTGWWISSLRRGRRQPRRESWQGQWRR
jgi:hypothetical protein